MSALTERDREALLLYWDLVWLYRHGLPKVPDVDLPDPQNPDSPVGPLFDPTPTPIKPEARLILHDILAFDRLSNLRGDPSPQPSIATVISDSAFRAESAKRMLVRFKEAAKALEAEIEGASAEQVCC